MSEPSDAAPERTSRHRQAPPPYGRVRRKEVDMSKTTYILIPGAGGDAWYWHLLTDHLEVRGHEVVAVSLPASDDSAGWAEYADTIVGAIGDRTGVILVAQSLAGFSAPLVCARAPVELLVLVNAMIPRSGETGSEWWSNTGQQEAMHAQLGDLGLPPESADDDATIYFHDVSPEVSAQAFQRGEPMQSWTPMTQPWPLSGWPDVPTRVLVGRDDRLFPARFQRQVARDRLAIGAEVIEGGHLVALSRPRELAERLESNRVAGDP
jgi:pimeloyl-ACP methyl ester carboxylesterase